MPLAMLRDVVFAAALTTAVVASPPSPAPTPAQATQILQLPANTVIELETVDTVSSRGNHPGDVFQLRVAEDVRLAGIVLIPAGTPAVGQVVHAAKAGGGGKAGELILAARYLRLPGGEVKLRSGFGATGRARVGASMATAVVVGVFGMLVKGKDLELPAGTALSARLAQTTDFPAP